MTMAEYELANDLGIRGMTHEDAFLADILEHPEEDAPRLIFADWLEDNGRAERATVLRWCVANGRWPEHMPGKFSKPWQWWHRCVLDRADGQKFASSRAVLPPELMGPMEAGRCWAADSLAGALDLLGAALARLAAASRAQERA